MLIAVVATLAAGYLAVQMIIEDEPGTPGAIAIPSPVTHSSGELREPVEIDAPPVTSEPEVIVQQGDNALLGRVISPAGNPQPGAAVSLFELTNLTALGTGRARAVADMQLTDPDGMFAFAQIPSSKHFFIRVEHPQYCTIERAGFHVNKDATTAIGDIQLTRGSTLQGRITSKVDGAGIEGADVQLFGEFFGVPVERDISKPNRVVVTDADGAYAASAS